MSSAVVPDISRVMDALPAEQAQQLDSLADQLQQLLHSVVEQGGPTAQRLKNWLNGTWLGHPLHPALTDAAIGAWSAGMLLDLIGAEREADAAMSVGVVSALPTAVAGAADWADTSEQSRRIGLIHGLLNGAGLVLMLGSLWARRTHHRGLGIGLSTLGLSLSTVSAWLGGELVYRLGTNVSRIAFEPAVDEFQMVARADSLEAGKLTPAELTVEGQTIKLVLLKRGSRITAISATCPHWGGPLAEGKLLEGDIVECPWHASQFRMEDGSVCQGPASAPAHAYETRIRDGNIEVRRRAM